MTISGRFEELVSRCVECDLAEPEFRQPSLGGSAPGVVDGILSRVGDAKWLSTTQMYCKQRSQQQAVQPEVFMTVLV